MHSTRSSLVVVAASTLLLLSGCAGGGSAASAPSESASSAAPVAEQSKTEACSIVQEQFTAFGASASSLNTSDPQAALESFTDLTAKTNAELNAITNAEVKPAAAKAAGALDDYVAFLQTIVSDPSKASELATQITTLQQTFTDAAKLCTS